MARVKKPPINYIDNKTFFTYMVKYHAQCQEAEQLGLPRPIIPEEIGKCIVMIANKLASKGNFVNYTYKDEMISDGIETCVRYLHKFDPTKSTNPFAYFTRVIYTSFLQRIEREKKQNYIQHSVLRDSAIMNTLVDMTGTDNAYFGVSHLDLDSEKMYDLILKYEGQTSSDSEEGE